MEHQQIFNELVAALRGELEEGYSAVSGFFENQLRLLAKQAATIAKSRANGSLKDDDEMYEYYLDSLKTNTENMVKAMVMLTALTLEKAWNAIAGILWGAIRTTLSGAGVPDNLLPKTPPINL